MIKKVAFIFVGLFLLAGGVIFGFFMSSYYWNSTDSIYWSTISCNSLIEAYEAVPSDARENVYRSLGPQLNFCAISLHQSFPFADERTQELMRSNLRELRALIGSAQTFSSVPQLEHRTLELIAEYE